MALEKNLEKLGKLMSLMDEDSLTKEDFLKQFEKVVELVLKIQKEQQEAIKRIEETHQLLLQKTEETYKNNHEELKGKVDHVFVKDRVDKMEDSMHSKHEGMKSEMKTMMEEVMGKMRDKMGSMDEKGGKMDRVMTEMMSQMESKMKSMKPPTMPTEYFDVMKEVREELKKVKNVLENRPQGKAMGRAKVPMFRPINLTSSQNGAARTFTIPPDTVRIHGGLSSQFPFAIEASDISRSGNQITLSDTIAPRETGQSLIIFTDALFYP